MNIFSKFQRPIIVIISLWKFESFVKNVQQCLLIIHRVLSLVGLNYQVIFTQSKPDFSGCNTEKMSLIVINLQHLDAVKDTQTLTTMTTHETDTFL